MPAVILGIPRIGMNSTSFERPNKSWLQLSHPPGKVQVLSGDRLPVTVLNVSPARFTHCHRAGSTNTGMNPAGMPALEQCQASPWGPKMFPPVPLLFRASVEPGREGWKRLNSFIHILV